MKIADNVGLVFLKVHWKYIMHAFKLATHLDYQHYCVCVCVCVPEHAVRSACKGLETTELCFIIVVGLPPNNVYVEFRFCCKKKKKKKQLWKSVSKCNLMSDMEMFLWVKL